MLTLHMAGRAAAVPLAGACSIQPTPPCAAVIPKNRQPFCALTAFCGTAAGSAAGSGNGHAGLAAAAAALRQVREARLNV